MAPANPIYDQLTLLGACLCNQIVVDGQPETCFCGAARGFVVAAYAGDCTKKCGMAWVRPPPCIRPRSRCPQH
jgi:hypothetical protein